MVDTIERRRQVKKVKQSDLASVGGCQYVRPDT